MGSQRSVDPSTLARYDVPAAVIAESVQWLRELSAGVREAVLLWMGRISDNETARVERVVVPRQEAGRLHFTVPLDERLRLLDEIAGTGEIVLVQLHTHPELAFHSAVDDRLAIPKHTGAISIVVPHFASEWSGDLLETSVNVHLGRGEWRELSRGEVRGLLNVAD